MIRVIAIDDEPLALKQLEAYIAKVPFFELAGSFRSAIEARPVLDEKVVDAMFLDINMPDLSGMDFMRMLERPPLVVFTTAYSEYAVDGFRVDAVDYLLKPFSLADFIRASNKVKARYEAALAIASRGAEKTQSGDSIFFRTDHKSVRVRFADIRYAEGMSEYIKVFTKGSTVPIVVLMGLKYLMEKLPEGQFLRIHRSYIVSLSNIKEVGRSEVRLEDGTVLPVGDMYRLELKNYLGRNRLE
ncbi:MAG: LytTR family DNA-binding domain-containing protein [Bacteroidales bacterium]|nr:LytTR family DNA-binding domain-containing protein [Bacteroidales bacterium]